MLLSSGRPRAYIVHHLPELTVGDRARSVGRSRLKCDRQAIAGEPISVVFELILPEQGLPVGGRLAIAWRWPLDFGELQVTNPDETNYLKAETDVVGVALDVRYFPVSQFDPWKHAIELTVCRKPLLPFSRVQVTCSQWHSPTCITEAVRFLAVVQEQESLEWRQLVDPTPMTVHPGPTNELTVIAPSDAVIGQKLEVMIRSTDRFGNLTGLRSPLRFKVNVDSPMAELGKVQQTLFAGSWKIPIQFIAPGRAILEVFSGNLTAQGNPIRVHVVEPDERLLWGDLHAGQGEIGCGIESLNHHFAFARDVAGLQFTSQQANDHYVSSRLWIEIQRVTEKWHRDGQFAAFVGCEWSAFTPDGGDRNLIFGGQPPELPRSGRFFIEKPVDTSPDALKAADLHHRLNGHDVVLNLHAGGRPTNLDHHAPEIESLFEIHSTHGTSDWFVLDAIRRGYRIGVTAGTDGVMARPGACHPGRRIVRNCRGGLTGIYAGAISRPAILKSFRQRCCYGTSGERIRLWVEIGGAPMGGQVRLSSDDKVRVSVSVDGTAPIDTVDLFRGTEIVASVQVAAVDNRRLRILWGGTEACGTASDQRVVWDGSLTVEDTVIARAEPIRFESPCDQLEVNSSKLHWQSTTAGGDAGVLISVEDSGKFSRYRFESKPVSFSFSLGTVMASPTIVPAGGVSRRVMVGPAARNDGPSEVSLELIDSTFSLGSSPVQYWVRVTQVDRGRAWSSPIAVDRASV